MIRLEKVSKRYKTGDLSVEALTDITLNISKGEFVSIMGASGSGKSTLMNILGCLDVPTSGSYTLNGRAVNHLSENELADLRNIEIGFVFQSFQLLPRLTALKNVELPMLYRGISKKERRERARVLLEKVGLSERLYHQPNELSGGQKQRVAIARALANNPSVLLADEPTGNLDAKSSLEIMQLLMELNEQGVTIVIVTHEDEVSRFTSRVISVYDGKIIGDRLNEEVGDTRITI